MQCMEVWGGNQAISSAVELAGLTAFVFSRPYSSTGGAADLAGGDIHYATSCATGRITRLCVADVAGHGGTVARASDALRRLMRTYSNYIDQSEFVRHLNQRFAELAETADDDAVQPGAFATAVVATYFAPTDELAISNAGHPRPMLYRSRDKAWSVIHADSDQNGPSNLPLGIDAPTSYPTTLLALGEGDLVLMYSDSLIEAQGSGGRMIGERGLLEILHTLPGDQPDGLIQSLLTSISPAGAAAMNDDVTAMLITRNAKKPRPSIKLSAMGAARIAAGVLGALRPGGQPVTLPQFDIASLGGSLFQSLNKMRRIKRS